MLLVKWLSRLCEGEARKTRGETIVPSWKLCAYCARYLSMSIRLEHVPEFWVISTYLKFSTIWGKLPKPPNRVIFGKKYFSLLEVIGSYSINKGNTWWFLPLLTHWIITSFATVSCSRKISLTVNNLYCKCVCIGEQLLWCPQRRAPGCRSRYSPSLLLLGKDTVRSSAPSGWNKGCNSRETACTNYLIFPSFAKLLYSGTECFLK